MNAARRRVYNSADDVTAGSTTRSRPELHTVLFVVASPQVHDSDVADAKKKVKNENSVCLVKKP